MLIFTAKIQWKKILLACALIGAMILCTVFLIKSDQAAITGKTATDTISPKHVRTEEDRVRYLQSYGWAIDPQSLAVEELLIPTQFDESYDAYLALQIAQGFDLTPYAGKRIKRYTYAITNHPSGEESVQVSLLIYRNTVIGGEVFSARSNGFLHGLAIPEAKSLSSI